MFWLPRLWNAKLTAAPPPCPPASLDCSKAGAGLKPFVPQLQTTFVKCLSDPQKEARLLLALVLRFRNVGPVSGIRQQLLLCSTRMHPLLLPTQAAAPGPSGILSCPVQVRQRAALNLGELTRMSMRADQLVAGGQAALSRVCTTARMCGRHGVQLHAEA